MKRVFELFIAIVILYSSSCTVNRDASRANSGLTVKSIQIRLDTVRSFADLISSQYGYGNKYKKLIDSLHLSEADTVIFFIRPCYTYRGVLSVINSAKEEEYRFHFSSASDQVVKLNKKYKFAGDFFSFVSNDKIFKEMILEDSVILIPDCPVILFLKLKENFYFRKISGMELNVFTDSSRSFRRLLKANESANAR